MHILMVLIRALNIDLGSCLLLPLLGPKALFLVCFNMDIIMLRSVVQSCWLIIVAYRTTGSGIRCYAFVFDDFRWTRALGLAIQR